MQEISDEQQGFFKKKFTKRHKKSLIWRLEWKHKFDGNEHNSVKKLYKVSWNGLGKPTDSNNNIWWEISNENRFLRWKKFRKRQNKSLVWRLTACEDVRLISNSKKCKFITYVKILSFVVKNKSQMFFHCLYSYWW